MIKRDVPFPLYDVDILSASDDVLKQVSSDMSLGLSLDEMRRIRDYFKAEGRNPTDVELQALGQAWSEHCCYKSSKPILKEFVFGLDRDDILSRGDAGVMVFDDEYGYALRIESHNHPSAIEPYGGAATGIGGILRDVVCMGAQPIGLADPLCFGPIDRKSELPPGIKHPRYLVNGVVSGIRDYGNRVGIPTITGGFFFDEKYTGNCLVNVACLGIVKRADLARNYAGGPGEVMILIGGRTGRDGIHGVNFASADLTATSDEDSRGAVQLGDPITKEPVMHACFEVNARHLITGMKDLGGGGLSCVVGEMALDAGCGADVDLDLVPLKEPGLAPWEIWVSESQERMMCTCKPENVDEVLGIFQMWDVMATPIARTTSEKRTRLFWEGEPIFDMDLEFLTGGPVYNRPYVLPDVYTKEREVFPDLPDDRTVILNLLSDPNVASKEWAIRQYDHEVRASTVIHPMVGPMNETGPGDASVLRPVPDRWRGLAAAIGCNPWFTEADPYKGGMACIDETCRNIVAVGARPNAFTDCLNFGNPEKPERLGEFREAVRGIGEIARALNIPIPSGNVSLYNLREITSLTTAIDTVIIVENPSIFRALSQWGKTHGAATIGFVCTAGQLNVCGYVLLDLIEHAGCRMFYAGDFDPEGLCIAQRLKQRYPKLVLWHYQRTEYERCRSQKTIRDSRLSMLAQVTHEELVPIKERLLIEKKSGYQEQLLEDYCKDLCAWIKQ